MSDFEKINISVKDIEIDMDGWSVKIDSKYNSVIVEYSDVECTNLSINSAGIDILSGDKVIKSIAFDSF